MIAWDKFGRVGFEKKQINTKVISGTLPNAIIVMTYNQGYTRFYIKNLLSAIGLDNNTVNVICSRLTGVLWNNSGVRDTTNNVHTYSGDTRLGITIHNDVIGIIDSDSTDTKISKLKLWLNTALPEIGYIITPTTTQLTFTKNNSSTAPECPNGIY